MNRGFTQFPQQGSNIIRNYLNNFEGTWKWTSGNSEIIIMLKKVNIYYETLNFYEDVVIGSHKYIQNGQVVEDFLPEFHNITADVFSSIFLFANLDGSEQSIIKGNIKDISLGKKQKLKLELLTNLSIATLKWSLESRGDVITSPPSQLGITLPTDILLERQ